MISHLQRKKICKAVISDTDRNIQLHELLTRPPRKTYTCEGCNKVYEDLSNYKKHRQSCLKKHGIIDTNENPILHTIETMQKQIQNLEQELKQRNGIVVNNNNIQNNNQTVTNNILQIKCTPFGTETIDHISSEELTKYLFQLGTGFTTLVKRIHFDNEQPMNRNIRYKSTKQQLLEVFEGQQDENGNIIQGRWVEHDALWVLEQVIQKGFKILSTHLLKTRIALTDKEEVERTETIRKYLFEVSSKKTNTFHGMKREIFVIIKDNTPICVIDQAHTNPAILT